MRVLVTGANGFVGREIIRELLERRDLEVFALAGPKGFAGNPPLKNFGKADITRPESLKNLEIEPGIDVLIHTAGLAHQFKRDVPEEEFFRVNAEGTENVLGMAKRLGVRHFILISSVAVYGSAENNGRQITEETVCKPEGPYAGSKLEAELKARQVCLREGIELTILRPATVIGEGDPGNVSRLIRSIERRRFIWIGRGDNHKTLVYKEDLARACRLVLENKKPSQTEVFNVAASPLKMKQIVGVISESLGKGVFPGVFIPPGFIFGGLFVGGVLTGSKKIRAIRKTLEKWISEEIFSAEKIKEVYGFEIQTPPLVGLERQVRSILPEV